MIPRRAAIILMTLFAVLHLDLSAWAAQSGPASADKRYALLIGINKYKSKKIPSLNGAVNDVMLIRRVLRTKYGFPEHNIRVITDAEATRSRILKELGELADRAAPEDVVYIHYSGHGSQVKDLDGDEAGDGLDETLVPHDGRLPGIPDITDDELQRIFAGVKSDAAIISLDSCHSGTATRASVQVAARFIPMDERVNLYEKIVPDTRAVVPLIGERHVLITAAADNESALDAPVDGTSYGLFTYSLAQSLQTAGADAALMSVFENLERELRLVKERLGLYETPEPQLEAPPERLTALLFPRPGSDATGPARLAWVEVRPLKKEKGVLLLDCVSIGAVPGSVWSVYPPDEREFLSGGAVASVTVTEQRGVDAFARLETSGTEVKSGSRAVLLFGPVPPSYIPVRWISGGAEDRRQLQDAISAISDEVRFVGEKEFARFMLKAGDRLCEVFGADGVTLFADVSASSNKELASRLVSIFERTLTAAELMSINNPASDIQLTIATAKQAHRSTERFSTRGVKVVSESDEARQFKVRRSSEPRTADNSLQLRIQASEDCYLTLVDLDSEGKVTVLFPNELSEKMNYYKSGLIYGGKPVLIPDSLEPDNRAGYYIDFAPPAGRDTIRGFCSAGPETAGILRRAIDELSEKSPTRGIRGTLRNVLTGKLRQDLTPSAFRGVIAAPAEGGIKTDMSSTAASGLSMDWAAASLSINLKE